MKRTRPTQRVRSRKSSRRSHRVGPGEGQMNLQKIYTALFTADLAAADDWYTKLLGRGPDYRPMDTLMQYPPAILLK
jgi:hypothetical protein